MAARRRGKYLWLPLDNGDALLGHLGMSGQLLVQPAGAARRAPPAGPLRLAGAARAASCASSTSGCSAACRSPTGGAELPPEIAHIARDPLDPRVRRRRVRRGGCARRTAGIKRLLLDQTLVSGVGNIYADEALWRARLHGERPGERLRPRQVRGLLGRGARR